MASIRRRELPDGTVRWDVRYRDGGGVQRTETFDREREARTRRGTVEHALGRSGGTWIPAAKVTLREAADAWFERKKVAIRDQTRLNYRSALDHWILPTLGARSVAAIRPSDVEALRAKMASDGAGANTIGNVTGVLRQVLAELVIDGALPSNPADHRLPGKRHGRPPRKITPPTTDEVKHLIASARLDARPVLELAASTGLRRAELLALTWADVDTTAREIHVRASKTDAGERVVPMFGSARRLLLEQKARSRFKRPEHPVFPTAVGTPHDPKAWHDREYLHAREKAQLPAVRLHDFRHYAVSQLIAQGASILLVAKIAGHARPDVTLRVYAHLFAEGLADAAERYDPARGIAVASAGASR